MITIDDRSKRPTWKNKAIALTKFKNLTMSSKGDRKKWDNKIGGELGI